MESHNRQSPGLEFREIDRSQYDRTTDNSITNTTVLVTGFSDKGEAYTATPVTTINSYVEQYGLPTNEIERYTYSCVEEVLSRRGRAIVARLPYDNNSKDTFTAIGYKLNKTIVSSDIVIDRMKSVDPSLTSYLQLSVCGDSLISMETYDAMKVGTGVIGADEVIVVDVSRRQYGVLSSWSEGDVEKRMECIGVMPVFVSPPQAMFFQGVISSSLSVDEEGQQFTIGLQDFQVLTDATNRKGTLTADSGYVNVSFSQFSRESFSTPLSASTIDQPSVSKEAASFFPLFNFLGDKQIEKRRIKSVGLVVFSVFKDQANENRIEFQPMESYIGQLDRRAKDPRTGASDFLGDIVNANSRLVNLFSNVKTDKAYSAAATIHTPHQCSRVLGFTKFECFKNVDYVNSIINPLTRILDACQDPNQVRIDIVCDAGVSNIAQFTGDNGSTDQLANGDMYPFPDGTVSSSTWMLESVPARWSAVLRKFDEFCKIVRKDCVFLADCPRPFALTGNEKAVRVSSAGSSIKRDILPKLKFMHALNSSYSAGYCNWYMIADQITGDFFWCPPSIKSAGVYVYTDAYHHTWDAPAGLERGIVRGAFDTAFDPRNDEAGQIYQQAWNYAVNYPMEGIVTEGQKTFQIQKTALDRMNVRRLMIWLEKSVASVARRFVYEGNTAYLRQKFVDTIRPIFEQAVSGYGVKEYAIRCDEQLNTPEVIDRNEMRCVIGVKPIKTVEWIVCDFICTNQSASVSEEVMRA